MQAITYTVSEHLDFFVLLAKSQEGVCAISLGKSLVSMANALKHDFPLASFEYKQPLLMPEWLDVQAVLHNPRHLCQFTLHQPGTEFQRDVWRVLRDIPCGHTLTYSQVAQAIGKPAAARAVASACAANRLALVVPCHRVIRSNGESSGYRWGPDLKRQLLAQEAGCVSGS